MSFFHLLDEVASPGAVFPEQFPWVAVAAAVLVLVAAVLIYRARKRSSRPCGWETAGSGGKTGGR